jgi:hypothetical protein
MRTMVLGLTLAALALGACGSPPKPSLAGRWEQNLDGKNKTLDADNPVIILKRTVELLPDGVGVDTTQAQHHKSGPETVVDRFTWAPSADGKSIRTESRDHGVLVAKVVALTETELRVEGLNHINGLYARAK